MNVTKNRYTKKTGQRGFSLIEVMVALVVLSVGLLGLGLLQITSMKFNTSAYLRSQSTLLANDLIERIRANPGGDYSATPASVNCSNGCTEDNVAILDLYTWGKTVTSSLASASTTVVESGGTPNVRTITINWVENGLPVQQIWKVEAS